MQVLIELTTKENQIVLDPFCGSGTTIIAAASLDRNYIGVELDKIYYRRAIERLTKYNQINENNLFSSAIVEDMNT
jgi:site-specific DNA-methyltransferase (adenine-specific)